MLKSQGVRALTIGVTALGLGIGGIGFSAAAQATDKPEVILCDGKGAVKPKEIVLACGDGNTFVSKIRWKKWTSTTATGVGTLTWNTCLPDNCAAGIVQKYRAKIELGGLASEPGETDVFSQMTLTFTQGAPGNLDTGTYILSNPRN